jgi:lysozyme family protein
MRDFSAVTIRRLARKGIRITGLQALPDMTSPMPYANASRGYVVDDNGCGRVWTFAQVMEAAKC